MKFMFSIVGLYSIGNRIVPSSLTMNSKEKFCKDCRFFKKDFFTETKYGVCSKFPIEQTDNYLVDGVKALSPIEYSYCSTARTYEKMCGKDGKYFESK